jgi:hypothetical protein
MKDVATIVNSMRPMLDVSNKMLNDMLEASKIVDKEYKDAATFDSMMMRVANLMVMNDIKNELVLRN